MRSLMMILFVVMLFALIVSPPAMLADSPANDLRESATVIAGMPYNDAVDITEATWDGPGTAVCTPMDANLWYKFVAPYAHYYTVRNPEGVWPWVVFEVFKETPEGLVSVACPWSGGGFISEAGATYLIMLSRISNGYGWVTLIMEDKGEPFYLEVTIDPAGGVSSKTGAATIGGTIRCSQPTNVYISTELRQTLGRKTVIYANSNETQPSEFPCNGEGVWSHTLRSNKASFGGGVAEVHLMASACGPANCQSADFTALTKLKGGK